MHHANLSAANFMSDYFGKLKKPHIIMSAMLVIIAVLCLVMIFHEDRSSGHTVNIISGGTLLRTYDMSVINDEIYITVVPASGSEEAYILEGEQYPDGHYNVIRISHNGVCVTDSDCPTGLCIHRGSISSSDIPIACLPNRLIITIDDSGESDTDAWTY